MNYNRLNIVCADRSIKNRVIGTLKNTSVFKDWNFFEIEESEIDDILNSRIEEFNKSDEILKKMRSCRFSINKDCILEVAARTSYMTDSAATVLSQEELNKLNSETFREYNYVLKNKYELELIVYIPCSDSSDDCVRNIDYKINQLISNYKMFHLRLTENNYLKEILNFLHLTDEEILTPEEVE